MAKRVVSRKPLTTGAGSSGTHKGVATSGAKGINRNTGNFGYPAPKGGGQKS